MIRQFSVRTVVSADCPDSSSHLMSMNILGMATLEHALAQRRGFRTTISENWNSISRVASNVVADMSIMAIEADITPEHSNTATRLSQFSWSVNALLERWNIKSTTCSFRTRLLHLLRMISARLVASPGYNSGIVT